MKGFLNHFLISLKLNFRNKQALVLGYLVPIFFLFAFGSIFKMGKELAQLITITILGGACFGMPITIVTERERGVWRRYRLVPLSTIWFVVSTMLVRFLIVLSAAILQVALAIQFYGAEMPLHPVQLLVAFVFVCFAFLGMGLIIAMVSSSTGAVQALGQSIFLPMLIVGGVAVPLAQLPKYARHIAAFLPGRYAVEALDMCMRDMNVFRTKPVELGLIGARFDLLALALIGISGCLVGAKLFRWEPDQKYGRNAIGWGMLALFAWVAVGLAAEYFGVAVPKVK